MGGGICRALSTVGISSAVLDLDLAHAESMAKASVCDVTDQAACAATVDEVVRDLGGVDVLVNLAQAYVTTTPMIELTADDLRLSYETGPIASLRMMQLCYPHMKGTRRGRGRQHRLRCRYAGHGAPGCLRFGEGSNPRYHQGGGGRVGGRQHSRQCARALRRSPGEPRAQRIPPAVRRDHAPRPLRRSRDGDRPRDRVPRHQHLHHRTNAHDRRGHRHLSLTRPAIVYAYARVPCAQRSSSFAVSAGRLRNGECDETMLKAVERPRRCMNTLSIDTGCE